MANAKDIKPDLSKIKACIYGASGTGKTYGLRTWPGVYVFDTDGGMLTLAGYDIEYDTYKDVDPLRPTAWRAIDKAVREAAKEPRYKTYAFDSLTTLTELCLADIQASNRTLGKSPTLQEWGQLIDRLTEFLMLVTSIPANVVVIAHEQMIQDEVTSEVFITPLVPGKKLPFRLPLFFDEVYRATMDRDRKTGEPVWHILTRGDRRSQAKTRLKGLEPIEVWNYSHLIAKAKTAYGQ